MRNSCGSVLVVSLVVSLVVFGLSACGDDLPTTVQASVSRAVPTQPGGTFGGADVGAPADASTGADAVPADTATPPDSATPDVRPEDVVGPEDASGLDATTPDTLAPDTTLPDPIGGPTPYPADRVQSPITPFVVQRLQAIAQRDPSLQDDVFMKVGASTTVSGSFLKCFAGNTVDFGAYPALESTRDFFISGTAGGTDPFSRTSLSAKSGVSARWAIDGDPPPLLIEYGATAPRFAFIHYGTNDMGLGSTYLSALYPFSENLWTIIDTLLDLGVIPILATIQRRLDRPAADLWVSTYNNVIRAIAKGRQVPLVDMWLANEDLPRHGLASDGLHSASDPDGPCLFDAGGLQYGMNNRNLQMLTVLSRLEAAILDGETADPPAPDSLAVGTVDDPISIDGLPFQDLRDTRVGPQAFFDRYPGCAATQNEEGPEFVYRLDLTRQTRLRATVHDLGTTDIDLHLLDGTGTPEGCIARHNGSIEATLDAGTYYLVLDTFVSGAGLERSGEYLLSLIECPAEDPTCGD